MVLLFYNKYQHQPNSNMLIKCACCRLCHLYEGDAELDICIAIVCRICTLVTGSEEHPDLPLPRWRSSDTQVMHTATSELVRLCEEYNQMQCTTVEHWRAKACEAELDRSRQPAWQKAFPEKYNGTLKFWQPQPLQIPQEMLQG